MHLRGKKEKNVNMETYKINVNNLFRAGSGSVSI
jgi:hypothetical protein